MNEIIEIINDIKSDLTIKERLFEKTGQQKFFFEIETDRKIIKKCKEILQKKLETNKDDYKQQLINKYFYHLEKCDDIAKEIYYRTELFEKQTMLDYENEIWSFFAGKSGRYIREYNKYKKLLKGENQK